MHGLRMALCIVGIAGTCFVSPGRAGQVRIDVGPNGTLSFSPQEVNLSQGDQVVWVWKSGGVTHTVTEGTPCTNPSNPAFDASGSGSSNTRFTWKADRTGTVGYFCRPHCASMQGTLNISASGVAVSDFRITEIFRTNDHTDDFIEIGNLGGAPGNLGAYRITGTISGAQALPLTDIVVPVDGRVVVHMGQSGTSTQTDVFFPSGTLAALGSVALYAPNTINVSRTDATQIVDFVRWGSSTAGEANLTDVAVEAGLWSPGEFLPQMPEGFSLEFCGVSGQHDVSAWGLISVPTPHTDGNCSTPVKSSTWGAVKALIPR
jgi:plastocyanin